MPFITEVPEEVSDSDQQFISTFNKLVGDTMKDNIHEFLAPIYDKLELMTAHVTTQPGGGPGPSEGTGPFYEQRTPQHSKKVAQKRALSSETLATGHQSDIKEALRAVFGPPEPYTRPSSQEEESTGYARSVVDYPPSNEEDSADEGSSSFRWDKEVRPKKAKPPNPSEDINSEGEEGLAFLDPEKLRHPRSAEWEPSPRVAAYIKARARTALDKEVRGKLKSECPRPSIEGKVMETPEIDPKMGTFLSKYIRDPKHGLDRSWRACQDKVLDTFGPLTKILDLTEQASRDGTALSTETVAGWAQRAVCFLGNANAAISAERRRSLLLKVDPKLGELANSEAGAAAKGLLFGTPFTKELTTFVSEFTSWDRAHTSMKKVFWRAGRGRSRTPGRGATYRGSTSSYSSAPQRGRGSYSSANTTYQSNYRGQNFYPRSRGYRGRGRGDRDSTNTGERFVESSNHRGQDSALLRKLARTFRRHMGVANSARFPTRFRTNPIHGLESLPHPVLTRRLGDAGWRSAPIGGKRSHPEGRFTPKRLPQQSLPRKEEGKSETSNQPESPELVRQIQTFQDGGYSFTQRSADGRRLVSSLRPQGRLSVDTNFWSAQTLPSVLVGRPNLGIHSPPLRSLLSTLVLHQTTEASNCGASEPRSKNDSLSGRYAVHGAIQRISGSACYLGSTPTARLGIRDQSHEIRVRSISIDAVFRFLSRYGGLCAQITPTETKRHTQNDQGVSTTSGDLSPAVGNSDRVTGRLHPGDIPRTPSLQSTTAVKGEISAQRVRVRSSSCTGPGKQGGTRLVVRPHGRVEWTCSIRENPRRGDRIRRQPTWLGSQMWLRGDRRSLVRTRKGAAHQLPRITSGIICDPLSPEEPSTSSSTPQDGQCVRCEVHQPFRRPQIPSASGDGKEFLELLPGSTDLSTSRIPPRTGERSGRLVFSSPQRCQRMETKPCHLPEHTECLGSFSSGPIRLSIISATSEVLQLEARPPGSGHRRFLPTVGKRNLLRFPAVCTNIANPADVHNTGSRVSDNSTSVASTTLDSHSARDGSRPAHASASGAGPSHISRRQLSYTNATRQPAVSSMEGVRSRWETEGLSSEAEELLARSWAPGTTKNYRTAWANWASWCTGRSEDPVAAPVATIVNYLAQFAKDKAYRTVNVVRSAISAKHSLVDGCPVGEHPLVVRVLRGVRLQKPPAPKYTSLWDVQRVLEVFRSWPANKYLSRKQLSAKLATLLCLVSCRRVSDVRAIDLAGRVFSPDGVIFHISRRTKTGSKTISYPQFAGAPKLCVVECLKAYEAMTADTRQNPQGRLFISLTKPYKEISSPTIARWVKWVMHQAGIDIQRFGAHSVRGAMASSAYLAGARLEDIMKAADWSAVSTFKTHYFKPILHMGQRVIDQR